jgi:tetratricopeptide (TPR) repeat protein
MNTATWRPYVVAFLMCLLVAAAMSGCGGGSGLREPYDYTPYARGAEPAEEYAERLLWHDRYEDALHVVKRWGQTMRPVRAAVLSAEANLGLGNYELAAEQYRTALDDESFWEAATWARSGAPGTVVVVGGGPELADAMARHFDPGTRLSGHLFRAAEAYLRVGDALEARRLCEMLEEYGYEEDPGLLMLRAEAAYQTGHYDEARADFERALESLDEPHARERLRQIDAILTSGETGPE